MGGVGWNVNTLYEHLTSLISGVKSELNIAIKAVEDTARQALASMNERMAAANEFRKSLEDANLRFANKDDLNKLSQRVDRLEGREESNAGNWKTWAILFPILISLATLVLLYFRK